MSGLSTLVPAPIHELTAVMLTLAVEVLLSWWSSASVSNNYRYLSAYVSISAAAVAAIGVYIGYVSDLHDPVEK
jgi:hypothetical protein